MKCLVIQILCIKVHNVIQLCHIISVYIKGYSGFILVVYNAMYSHIKGVKRSSKYTVRVVMLCLLKVSKEAQNTL